MCFPMGAAGPPKSVTRSPPQPQTGDLLVELRFYIGLLRGANRRLAIELSRMHLLLTELEILAHLPDERRRCWHRIIPPFLTRRMLMTALDDLVTNLAAATTAATALGATADRAAAAITSSTDSPALVAAAASASSLATTLADTNTKLAAHLPPTV